VFTKPAYQSGLSGSGRHVPDVALVADPSTGFAVSYQGGLARVGGTSLSSPLFAGLLAGALSANGSTSGVGDIHSNLYAAPAKAFQDVVTGNNGFAADVGYDDVTGLGAPRFGALAAAFTRTLRADASLTAQDPQHADDTSRRGTCTRTRNASFGPRAHCAAAGPPPRPPSTFPSGRVRADRG